MAIYPDTPRKRAKVTAWETIQARVPKEVAEDVFAYQERMGLDNKSDALRLLVAAGLEVQDPDREYTTQAILASAKAMAMNRMGELIRMAFETFRHEELGLDQ
jgi:hypothetical protein